MEKFKFDLNNPRGFVIIFFVMELCIFVEMQSS